MAVDPSAVQQGDIVSQGENTNYRTFVVCGVKFTVDRKYKLIKPIGHGAYGVVWFAISIHSLFDMRLISKSLRSI